MPDKKKSTQQAIPIKEIRDGIVVTKTGGYRVVMLVSTVNFALKSETEQNAIIFGYQNFLNSLNFPIQIVIQSKKLDLDEYLNKLIAQKEKTESQLVRMQITDYIDFIKRLITIANIMEKRFFVVIPYDPVPLAQGGILSKLIGGGGGSTSQNQKPKGGFETHKATVLQRASLVASGLGTVGLRAIQLTTPELIELAYSIYNPETATKQRLTDITQLTAEIIEKKKEDVY